MKEPPTGKLPPREAAVRGRARAVDTDVEDSFSLDVRGLDPNVLHVE
jgi:hypothetical protein